MPFSSKFAAIRRLLGRRLGLALAGLFLVFCAALAFKLIPFGYNRWKLSELQGRKVYDEKRDSGQALERALARAKRENKRVLVTLGGNWCQWCLALDALVESDPELKQLVTERFVPLKLDADEAEALDEQWGKPTENGVPVLVFLNPSGSVAHVQETVALEVWGGRLLAHDRDKVYEAIEPWVL